MGILLLRIDDRLIHGQVVEGWVKAIKADHIVVASDVVAQDEMQIVLLTMAVPPTLKVSVLSLEQAAAAFKNGAWEKDKVLFLISSPQDAVTLIQKGLMIKSVNVGGIHFCAGKKQIAKTICVDNQDVTAFQQLDQMGIELEGRIVPSDEKINIMEHLKKRGLLG